MSLLKLTSQFCVKHLNFRHLPSRHFRSSSYHYTGSTPPTAPTDELGEIDHEKYGKLSTFYKFPHMAPTQVFFSSKYVFFMATPPSWIFEALVYYYEFVELNDVILFNIIKVVFIAKILLLNKWFTNLVGFMYLTEDDEIVVAYVNFWGRRIDEKFGKGVLQIESSKINILNKLWVTLRCSASDRKLKLHLKTCKMNEFVMVKCFGVLPRSAF